MSKQDLWAGFTGGCITGAFLATALVFIRDDFRIHRPINECERSHNVYQCQMLAVPVTPDGQPLDMSDPFHGEDE